MKKKPENFVDQDSPSATMVAYLQNATHEMRYMVANSNAMLEIHRGGFAFQDSKYGHTRVMLNIIRQFSSFVMSILRRTRSRLS